MPQFKNQLRTRRLCLPSSPAAGIRAMAAELRRFEARVERCLIQTQDSLLHEFTLAKTQALSLPAVQMRRYGKRAKVTARHLSKARELRGQGLTMTEIAQQLGISRTSVSLLLSGNYQLRITS